MLAGHARCLLVFRSTLGSVSTFSALWRFFQRARMGLRSRWYACVFTPSSFCELNYFVYIFCPSVKNILKVIPGLRTWRDIFCVSSIRDWPSL